MNVITKSGYFGGKGGTRFKDKPPFYTNSITALSLHCDKSIHQLAFTYANGRTIYHGRPTGTSHELTLHPNEHIIQVTIVASKRTVRSLEFTTDRQRTVRSLETKDKDYANTTLEAPKGCILVGVYGRAGVMLDGLGCLWGKKPRKRKLQQTQENASPELCLGGTGGTAFDGGVLNGTITEITIHSGMVIHQLEMMYTLEKLQKKLVHGRSRGLEVDSFVLQVGEYVIEVQVLQDEIQVMQLLFRTTHGRELGPCGCKEEIDGQGTFMRDVVRAPSGQVLLGVHGTAGKVLQSIGFHWGVPPQTPVKSCCSLM